MLTAVDSSALLDVVTRSVAHADHSESAPAQSHRKGGLVVCECVVAEIGPAFANEKQIPKFLGDWQMRFIRPPLRARIWPVAFSDNILSVAGAGIAWWLILSLGLMRWFTRISCSRAIGVVSATIFLS